MKRFLKCVSARTSYLGDLANMTKGNPIEENNSLMGRGAIPEDSSLAHFLYNKNNGTVCGRNGLAWMQIIVFYIIFYSCLAAFWLACLAIFLNTLDDKVPCFYGKGTIIGINPGVAYQPWLKENPDSTLIQYNLRDSDSSKPYVRQLENYLKKYANTNNTRQCTGSQSNRDANGTVDACRFTLDQFDGCMKENDYGYTDGNPCVVISLNRLIGWQPADYNADSVDEVVKDRYKPGSVAIHCEGTNQVDKEHLGQPTYLPAEGIRGIYFPYSVMSNYHQPIAMVKFNNVPRNKIIMVTCRAFAANIVHDFSNRLGLVQFELNVQDKEVIKKTE